jgi:hypothetical protein
VEHAIRRDPTLRYASAQAMNRDLGVPGLLPRVWYPIEPHPGHVRCWQERRDRGSGATVCVFSTGQVFSVEVRRDTPTKPRISGFCRADVRERDVAKVVGATFVSIANAN